MSRLESVLFFLILGVVATLRFGWPDLVFYGPDQGLLLTITDRFYEQHLWPWVGLVGTKGVFYGPLPSWILIFFRGLCPEHITLTTWLFYCINALHLSAVVYFLIGLRLVLRRSTWWVFSLFVLTLPNLTFYARLVWDNTFLIVLSLYYGGFYLRQLYRADAGHVSSRFLWLAGGLTAGAAIDIHLFALPLAISAWYASCSLTEPSQRVKRDKAIFVGAMLILVAPYCYGLLHAPAQPIEANTAATFHLTRFLTGFRAVVVLWTDWFSMAGFLRYFATGKEIELMQSALGTSAEIAKVLFAVIVSLQALLASCGLFAIVRLVRMRSWCLSTTQMRLISFASIAALAHFVLAVMTDATHHIHYFQVVWWMPLVTTALWWDQFASVAAQNFVKMLVLCVVVCNLSLEVFLGRSLIQSRGYTTPQLGPTLPLQSDIVDMLCQSTPDKMIAVTRVVPEVSRSMMMWLSHHSNYCRDVVFVMPDDVEIIAQYVDVPSAHIIWRGE